MQDLKKFTGIEGQNFFENDVGFQKLLSRLLPIIEKDRVFPILKEWGSKIPLWGQLAAEAARPDKFPRIEKFDRVGNRLEKVILPIETRTIRREVVEMGIFDSKTEVEKFAKVYLLAKMGESGVTCPLACTDGLIRVLEGVGSSELKEKFIPQLRSLEFPLAGAQFVTEQSGGSDVGAIEATATPQEDGTWAIVAEKWYCSACDEFFLVAARPEGGAKGTEGIAIFLVPRVLDGKPNGLSYRRLKNKLGTQSLPTAEIDFEGATGYLIGKKESGFHHLMNYVLNASRIHNAANSLGLLARAFAEARHYAGERRAFGKPIIEYPMVAEYLLSMQADLSTKRAAYFSMLKQIDQGGFLPKDREQRLWQRFLINLLKYRTSYQLMERLKEGILVFGANGIIEDFSVLPRLFRDGIICETWEGTHNVLCLQILRDSTRFDFWSRFHHEMDQSNPFIEQFYQQGLKYLTVENLSNPEWVEIHARRIVDWMGLLIECMKYIELEPSGYPLVAYLLQGSHFDNSVLNDPNLVSRLII